MLAIGGVKEKVLGAKRAGIKKILLPKRNEMDLDDVPKEVRDSIQFTFVEELSEVFAHALGKRVITPVLLGAEEPRRGNNVVALRPRAGVKRPRTAERKRSRTRRSTPASAPNDSRWHVSYGACQLVSSV